jgi:hypothetical protein
MKLASVFLVPVRAPRPRRLAEGDGLSGLIRDVSRVLLQSMYGIPYKIRHQFLMVARVCSVKIARMPRICPPRVAAFS